MKYILMFGILGILLFIFGGYQHESVHQQIFNHYGIKSNITIDFPDLITTPEKGCKEESCILANNINDAISYNLDMFYLLFFTFGIIIISLIELKYDLYNCKEV